MNINATDLIYNLTVYQNQNIELVLTDIIESNDPNKISTFLTEFKLNNYLIHYLSLSKKRIFRLNVLINESIKNHINVYNALEFNIIRYFINMIGGCFDIYEKSDTIELVLPKLITTQVKIL